MLLLVCLCLLQDKPTEIPKTLTVADKALFDQLFREGLFDPKDATWMNVTFKQFSYGREYTTTQRLWKKEGKFYHCNGAQESGLEVKDEKALNIADSVNAAEGSLRFAGGIANPPPLAIAAWCYRSGKDEQAAAMLHRLRQQQKQRYVDPNIKPSLTSTRYESMPTELADKLQWDLAWISYAGMVHSFQVHRDTQALAHGVQLEKHFSHGLQRFPSASVVLADLRRRDKEGKFNTPKTDKLPEAYAKWSVEEKIKFLIQDFQEIDEFQMSQPGGVHLGNNYRVRELAKLGEAALPALFDCLEKDERLVRTISYWRNFHPNREVHFVAEAAMDTVYMILKTIPASPEGVDYRDPPLKRYRAFGAAARKYWEANHNKSPLLRHYETLCNLQFNDGLRCSAMNSLLVSDSYPPWMNEAELYWPVAPSEMKTELEQFQNPTVAEALWRCLDNDTKPQEARDKYHANQIARSINRAENYFIAGLVALGDRRVIPEMQKRQRDEKYPFRYRLKLAYALHQLGDSKALAQMAKAIGAGREPKGFSIADDSDHWELVTLEFTLLVRSLVFAGIPETDAALDAIANNTHPLHNYFAVRLKPYHFSRSRESNFYSHPYCMKFYREWLKDTSPSGSTYEVKTHTRNNVPDESLSIRTKQSNIMASIYGIIKEKKNRRDKVETRVCDDTMLYLTRIILGLPAYHPLRTDSQQLFDRNMKWLETYTLRRKTNYEATMLGSYSSDQALIPDLKPLEQVATGADVEAGRAAFSLNGQAQRLELKLPAWVVLKKDVQGTYIGRRGLVFQAESLDGKKYYGALFADGIRQVKEEEVHAIEAFDPTSVRR